MGRFAVGDTVYMGRGYRQRELVVAVVRENRMIPITQYGFEAPNDGFLCGEQSIRANPEDRDFTLSECMDFKDKESQVRINTLASATYKTIEETSPDVNLPKLAMFDSTRVDFKPSLDMVEWITERAAERIIIHIGSGQGHLVNMARRSAKKIIGIEPNFDKRTYIEWMAARDPNWMDRINEILEGGVGKYKKLIHDAGADRTMLIIARPKVRDFVFETLKLMPWGMELLYIDLEVNVEQNDALGMWKKYATKLNHKGRSEESEVVYSIVKSRQ